MKYTSSIAAALVAVCLLSSCGPKGSTSQSSSQSNQSLQPPAASQSQPSSSISSSSAPGQADPAASSAPQGGQAVYPEPTHDPEQLLAAVEQADWTWFDDAVMIGDSVSLKLKNFVVKERQSDPDFFGTAQFLTSGSLGSGNALWEVSDKSVHPTFQGEKMLLEQSIPQTGAKKIFLMLGVNDIAVYGIDGAIENYGLLLDQIQQAAPDVEFYIQSATPICQGAEVGALNNENLELYNEELAEMCRERGIRFVDVAAVLRGEDGFLPREYCSDPDGMGIHLTDVACKLWLGYLYETAQAIQGL